MRPAIWRLPWARLPVGCNCELLAQDDGGGRGAGRASRVCRGAAGTRNAAVGGPRRARRRRRGTDVLGGSGRAHPLGRRQRDRCRRRDDARGGSGRDLALRPRRRGPDHHLFRKREPRRRHQRPGIGAKSRDPRDVRRPRGGAGQRPERRDDPGRGRCGGAGARTLRDQVVERGTRAGDRAGRRVSDVRLPGELPDVRAQGVGSVPKPRARPTTRRAG